MRLGVKELVVRGLRMEVAVAGAGPAVLLIHGIPHTWFLWRRVIEALSTGHLVIAPDLRGLGGSERAQGGYDVATLAADLAAVLDALHVESASVVGIDLGVQTAVMLALTAPHRVRRLVVMEGLVGALPGAESFLARGAPWWFGFHAVPALPEMLITGHEAAYVDFFLRNGTHQGRGVSPEAREVFVNAYSGRESIRCMCEHYRAMPQSSQQLAQASSATMLEMPTLSLEGGVVGAALSGQLRRVTSRLSVAAIEGAAHLIPEDQPEPLLAHLRAFLGASLRGRVG